MKLEEAAERIGAGVVYRPLPAMRPTYRVTNVEIEPRAMEMELTLDPQPKSEDGVITSVNDTYVFVQYVGDRHSKATRPEDLEFLCP